MPPEMMRIESGSATTAATKVVPEISQETFLCHYLFRPRRGVIANPDTNAGEPFLERPLSDSSGLQNTFQKEWVRRALQAQLTFVLQPQKQPSPITETISPEAKRRFHDHARVVQEVCSFAKAEAQTRRLTILKIDVRPAWSHEYDERTGIVIDVEIKASSDERFSYWDAVCEQLNQMENMLSQEDQAFLTDEISFIVSRS